jgi:hypothetical protein
MNDTPLPENDTPRSRAKSGESQHGVGLAKEVGRLTGFSQDADGPRQLAGVVLDGAQIGVKASKHKDTARRQLAGDRGDEVEAVPVGHHNIAKEEVGAEAASEYKPIFYGVGRADVEPVLPENQGQCVSDHNVVVDNENALRSTFHSADSVQSISNAKVLVR